MPRAKLDLYETPPHYVQALLDVIGDLRYKSIYEPCVGKGAIMNRVMRSTGTKGREWITNDIDRRRVASTHYDATTSDAWQVNAQWAITNPPFRHEQAILQHALRTCPNVAFLARLSFLEPTQDRTRFWKRYLCNLSHVIVLTRYSFRRNDRGQRGSDSQTCCWLVFRQRKVNHVNLIIDGRRQDR